ncbi:tetratricopeptide repeat-containing sensor histidine kinase [Mucilaginibacter sp.]|uniref:tetratricopeptide repeat-containing sensor histidine kinase n=1 Tax=Mucilaginibacter sp. TaxID=1882438 RepID=UPI003D127238
MQSLPLSLRLITHAARLCFLFVVIYLSSCTQKGEDSHNQLKEKFRIVDSLIFAGKGDSAIYVLRKLRPEISESDPLICVYYRLMSEHYNPNAMLMNRYADSAIVFFSNDDVKKKYPDIYFQSLLAKGDACIRAKNYSGALNYYYTGKKTLSDDNCDNGNVANKIGAIYFEQRNYLLAARYWGESYKRLQVCHKNVTAQQLFFMNQAALNNTGFSYFKADVLDSAEYYYLKDVDLINKAEKTKLIDQHNISSSWVVVYDNLGGLNLKKGNLPLAESYLNKCLALNVNDINGSRVTPLLKVAELYIRMNNDAKANEAFMQSGDLLNRFPKNNELQEIKWNLLYARYLNKIGQPDKAYNYQSAYIRLRDSSDNSSLKLYRLDIEQELNITQQKNVVVELEKQNKQKKIYLTGFSIFVIFAVAIILMINQILKKTKENQKETILQNQKLQYTLSELERVNKNYIRIMRVMAHDLRNPLSGITGLATLLIDENEFSEDSKSMLRLIETTGMHSMQMINELLKTGLADENEKLVTQKTDLKSLVYDCVELLQFKAKEKQQQILFECNETGPVMAEVNHEKIWRVVNNLIVNAIKFSHAGGIIKVGIKIIKNQITIWVADNGIGIPADQKDTIFEMFTPAKKTGTDGEQPFGLGLSISKRIIEMHHGKIGFENNPFGGSIFFIELPGIE